MRSLVNRNEDSGCLTAACSVTVELTLECNAHVYYYILCKSRLFYVSSKRERKNVREDKFFVLNVDNYSS